MRTLLAIALLLSASVPAIAGPDMSKPSDFRKPEDFNPSYLHGAKKMMFEKSDVSMATAEQFEAALQAVKKVVVARGEAEAKEASEDGTKWYVLDHDPHNIDDLHNYSVVEFQKFHKRPYSVFSVRTELNGYDKNFGWAWHGKKVRYVVYVGDDLKILAIKEQYFSTLIDFMEWKYAIEEKDAKMKKVLTPAGYSTELYEETASAKSSSAQ
ncbi:MAG: hypothetical protein ACXVBE_03855 [Bdellovibrionota bacterium]